MCVGGNNSGGVSPEWVPWRERKKKGGVECLVQQKQDKTQKVGLTGNVTQKSRSNTVFIEQVVNLGLNVQQHTWVRLLLKQLSLASSLCVFLN